MNTVVRGFSVSVQIAIDYQQAMQNLRESLARNGFEILFELSLDRELERKAGLSWTQVGLNWQHYTILLVWSPLDAYPALLSDRDGGLLVPLNLCIAESDNTTFISAANQNGALKPGSTAIGIQTLVREQTNKIRHVLSELATHQGGSVDVVVATHS